MGSLANAQTSAALDQYNQRCPANDGQEVEIQPGLFVTYHCGQAIVPGVSANANPATDPDACVLACEQSSGCVGSMWSARPGAACYLVQHQGQPDLRVKTRVVYMSYRREEVGGGGDIFPEDPEDIFPEDDDCDSLLADSQAVCNEKIMAFKKPYCRTAHDKPYVRGGKTYQTWCNHDLQRTGEFYHQTNLMFDACLDLCSSQSQCKAFLWFPQAGAPCKLYNNASGKGKLRVDMVIAALKL